MSASGRPNVTFYQPMLIILVRYHWFYRIVGGLSVFSDAGDGTLAIRSGQTIKRSPIPPNFANTLTVCWPHGIYGLYYIDGILVGGRGTLFWGLQGLRHCLRRAFRFQSRLFHQRRPPKSVVRLLAGWRTVVQRGKTFQENSAVRKKPQRTNVPGLCVVRRRRVQVQGVRLLFVVVGKLL